MLRWTIVEAVFLPTLPTREPRRAPNGNPMSSTATERIVRFTDLALDLFDGLALRTRENPQVAIPTTGTAQPPFDSFPIGCKTHRIIRAFFIFGLRNPNQSPANPTASTIPASDGSTLIGMIALNLFQ